MPVITRLRRSAPLVLPLLTLIALTLPISLPAAEAAALSAPSSDETAAAKPQSELEQELEQERRYRDEITITGRGEQALTRPSPEAAEAALEQVPGGASFVDAEEYRAGRVSTLDDALGLAPGVVVQPRFGAEEARLSIRGSGLQRTFHGRGLRLLQDGVPLNLADGAFDFQAVEPLAARYVEVLRGPNALRYGAATLGGAINFLSYNGHESPRVLARVEGGSFDYRRAQAASGGSFGGEAAGDYYVSLSHFAQDGFREHARQDTQRLFGNLGWRLGPSVESRLYLTAVRTDSELPGSLTRAQLEADPSQANPGNLALDQRRDFELGRLASRTSFVLSPRDELELDGSWSWKQLDHPIFQVLDQRSDDFGVEARWSGERTLAGARHRLVVGLAPSYGELFDRRYRNVAGERGAPTARGWTRSTNAELYAEDRVELSPRWTAVLGAQAAWAERDFEDEFLSEGDQTSVQEYDALSPKLGVFFQAAPTVALFANLARSFEPPSFGELVNVGGGGLLVLDAQEATSIEVGGRGSVGGRSGGGPLRWDLVGYHARIDGELLGLADEAGNPLGTINADRTTHSGVELGVGFDRELGGAAGEGQRLDLRSAYTWSRFRFDDDPVYGSNQLAGFPEHQLRAELSWSHPRGFYAGPKVEWSPSGYPVDHANTLFADSYTLIGAELGYRSEGGWSVFADGRNLTDETYAATTGVIADARGRDSAQFLPGDGRSVFAGFEWRWK